MAVCEGGEVADCGGPSPCALNIIFYFYSFFVFSFLFLFHFVPPYLPDDDGGMLSMFRILAKVSVTRTWARPLRMWSQLVASQCVQGEHCAATWLKSTPCTGHLTAGSFAGRLAKIATIFFYFFFKKNHLAFNCDLKANGSIRKHLVWCGILTVFLSYYLFEKV